MAFEAGLGVLGSKPDQETDPEDVYAQIG